jgi:hypothetical protein
MAASILCPTSGLVACPEVAGAATAILGAREEVNVRTDEYEYAVLKCVHCVADGAGVDAGLERAVGVWIVVGTAVWRWIGSARYVRDRDGRPIGGVGVRYCSREKERVDCACDEVEVVRRVDVRSSARMVGVRDSIVKVVAIARVQKGSLSAYAEAIAVGLSRMMDCESQMAA